MTEYTGESHSFDDRESFRVAEAVLRVVVRRCPQFESQEEAWEKFIGWRGRGDEEYLRHIFQGRSVIFYSLLLDLYDFAEYCCGQDVTGAVGAELADLLFQWYLPHLLETSLFRSGSLEDRLIWLIRRFFSGATGELYDVRCEYDEASRTLRLRSAYRHRDSAVEYLRRTGHNPEYAFSHSFAVMRGALLGPGRPPQ